MSEKDIPDDGPDRVDNEDTDASDGKPCCKNEPETINLPFATEDGVTEVPLIKSHPSLSPMHDWEHRLRLVLDELLDTLENKKDHGFFDSIMDVQTHALLIEKAMSKYIEEHNKRWAKREGVKHEPNPELITTPADLKSGFNRGGYSVEKWNRIHKILTGENYKEKNETQLCPRCSEEMENVYGQKDDDGEVTTGYKCKKCGTEKEVKVNISLTEDGITMTSKESTNIGDPER